MQKSSQYESGSLTRKAFEPDAETIDTEFENIILRYGRLLDRINTYTNSIHLLASNLSSYNELGSECCADVQKSMEPTVVNRFRACNNRLEDLANLLESIDQHLKGII